MKILSALSKLFSLILIVTLTLLAVVAVKPSNAFTLYDGSFLDPRESALFDISKRSPYGGLFKRGECGCGLGCFYSSARGCAACCSLGL
ncbi:unnamed protein product [Toxocara canis]|uniref:Secreted protein n=1 Tax=Toxocara canis TaxID=6265 RepID=A0A183V517_TOXCA|nr:unnamed protein product [Toxocara canis]